VNGVIGILKKRWPLVVSVAVIVVVLPVSWFFSSGMNASIRESRAEEANGLIRELNQLTVSYELPAPVPGMEEVSVSGVMPHEELTAFFRERQQAQTARLEEVVGSVEAFNRKGRTPLVEGLFPKQPTDNSEAQLLRLRMQDMLIPGLRPDEPSAYERLLGSVNATSPPDPQEVLDRLTDEQGRLLEREQARSGREDLTPEESAAIQEELTARRVGLYARAAQEHSLYVTLDVFPQGMPTNVSPAFPRQRQVQAPSHDLTFLWQLDYWLAQDLVGFLRLANTRNGRLLPIAEAPVKRVVSLSADPFPLRVEQNDDPYGDSAQGGPGPDPSAAVFEPRYGASPSGRDPNWRNQLYDVRTARVSLIVDSARIDEVLDATSRQNLITVTDVDVQSVDVWSHVEQGYYYGDDHVVQLDLGLELIYLRSWTAEYMPNSFRGAVGLEPHPLAEGEQPPAEEPRPARDRGRDDRSRGRGLR